MDSYKKVMSTLGSDQETSQPRTVVCTVCKSWLIWIEVLNKAIIFADA